MIGVTSDGVRVIHFQALSHFVRRHARAHIPMTFQSIFVITCRYCQIKLTNSYLWSKFIRSRSNFKHAVYILYTIQSKSWQHMRITVFFFRRECYQLFAEREIPFGAVQILSVKHEPINQWCAKKLNWKSIEWFLSQAFETPKIGCEVFYESFRFLKTSNSLEREHEIPAAGVSSSVSLNN